MRARLEVFLKYRYLMYELVTSDIKIKYRRSMLGIVWSVLQPLMMMLILTVVFSTMFKSNIEHFAVYVLTGRIVWDLFSLTTGFALNSVVLNASLIKKVYIPKYIFPISRGLSALVNTGFSLIALILVVIFTGVKVNFTILLFPIPLLLLFMFSIGVGLAMSAITVFFRDMAHLYEVLLTAWMYLTPIFYPANILPKYAKTIMNFNPIYHYLDLFRKIVMYGQVPTLGSFAICFFMGIGSIILGSLIFAKNQDKFILHI